MTRTIQIALLGLGTVGSGVARLLLDHAGRIERRVGLRLRLKYVVEREPDRPREVAVPRDLLVPTVEPVLADPEVRVAVELWGGLTPAREVVLQLLDSGKDLVTANKALLAEHGPEIFDRAYQLGRCVSFEAAVAAGVPIIAAVVQSFAANQISSVAGILNGTSNFILTAMAEEGRDYQAALARAQQLGYAEADPTLDVDGTDAAQKLAILAQLSFGCRIAAGSISRQGIDKLEAADVRFAAELGYTIKLLATARLSNGQIELVVGPTLVRRQTPLAEVRGPYNAVQVVGDAVGDTLFYGRGAGAMPTASAVVADIIDTALGRAARTFQTLRLWTDREQAPELKPPDQVRSRYYLRFVVRDRPGVLARIARVLGDNQISISSVIQHEAEEGHPPAMVPLVIMTHAAVAKHVQVALTAIDGLEVVQPPSVCMPVQS